MQALWGARLKERRPLQYLLSCAHWWKITLAVGPGCVLPLVRRFTLWVEASCRVCHQAADACARGVPPAPGAVAWYTAGTVEVACLALLAGTFYLTCCGKALPANQFVAAYSITAPAPFFLSLLLLALLCVDGRILGHVNAWTSHCMSLSGDLTWPVAGASSLVPKPSSCWS